MVGTGRAAQAGVLIKNAEALEVLSKINTLVLDKTGTLTEGKPTLITAVALPGFEEDDILRWAGALEKGSEHPLASAIVRGVEDRKLGPLESPSQFESLTGRGVKGVVAGKR